jgi:DNA transformation protein
VGATANYVEYVLDQLSSFARVTSRRMFGGVGLYADGFFFALIDDTLYFKVDDSNRADYLARHCRPFQYSKAKDGKIVSMGYYAVPEDVLDDPDELKTWARKSLAVAVAAAAKKKH